jgi:hypothetical protein
MIIRIQLAQDTLLLQENITTGCARVIRVKPSPMPHRSRGVTGPGRCYRLSVIHLTPGKLDNQGKSKVGNSLYLKKQFGILELLSTLICYYSPSSASRQWNVIM